MVKEGDCWIGINTSLTNHLVEEGLRNGIIDDFGTIETIQREVTVSSASRLDFLIQGSEGKTFIEVKNCSLAEDGVALFPDAVTKRGTKHLHELNRLRREGLNAAVLFCVQRSDAHRFRPAVLIDPEYAATLYEVSAKGVKVLAYQADVSPERISIARKIDVFDSANQNDG